MRNTPPPAPICERDTDTLIEDLCLGLRNVGVFDRDLPDGETIRQHIAVVCAIKRELDQRGISTDDRIAQLSVETNWRIFDLLQECLEFPDSMPYVKEADGIRRSLRCNLCRRNERPPDAQLCWWCDECILRVLDAIKEAKPIDGVILFRTYNSEARCQHADSETVLVSEYYSDTIYGSCGKCLAEELARRRSTVDGPGGTSRST
jgi:hypothetical protein